MPYFLDLGENIFQAEHPIFHVIDSLEESFQWGKIFDMTLFCTHSPCRGCCQKIIQFMLLHDKAISHNKPISRLSIRFVQLHQVEQAQCYPREWLQATPITDIVHNETVKALSELYANGKIDIKPFDASSWSALRQVLGRPQLQCSRELQYQESLGIKPKLLIDWKCLEAEMVKIQDRKLAAQTNQLNITY